MMQKIQKFGGAMFTPVLLFAFSGIMVGLATLFKNEQIVGSIANPDGLWFQFWWIIEQGAWTIFNQMPLVFVVGLPIGLAKKQAARACMEALVIYLTFNYFLGGILELWGSTFGVNFALEPGGASGLALIAGIKTLDMGILGAIMIAAVSVYLHNKFFDTELPEFLGIFKGSTMVYVIGFFVMIPVAFMAAFIWPKVQLAIMSLQSFMATAGPAGIGIYSFLNRILIPTGLHHFINFPFLYDNVAVQGGVVPYWTQHLSEFAANSAPLIEQFPQGGFALYGNVKIFGSIGIALAFYKTAKAEKKKALAGLLIPATLTAIFAGVTEPLEFTFLFIAPVLFLVHSVLSALLDVTLYTFGVVGSFSGGMIEFAATNWIPLGGTHGMMYVKQIVIGLIFTVIYFFVFRTLILKFNFKTPGREEDDEDTKLYYKDDFKKKKGDKSGLSQEARKAKAFLAALGGKGNITDVTNCVTRLRIGVKDPNLVAKEGVFKQGGALGLVQNDKAIQIIVGLTVPNVREEFENLLAGDEDDSETAELTVDVVETAERTQALETDEFLLTGISGGSLIPQNEIKDQAFSTGTLGPGFGIVSQDHRIYAPFDGEVIAIFPTKHAIGLKSKDGLEMLIHVGIDTVQLDGEGFCTYVEQEDSVQQGQLLLDFDADRIEKAGYDLTIAVVFVELTDADEIQVLSEQAAQNAPMVRIKTNNK